MTELYLVLAFFAVVVFCIFLVVKSAKRSAASEERVDSLETQIRKASKINEVLSRPRKMGKNLLDSLRNRASRGMPDK
jgi:Flp pilus assembly protein TadB